MVTALVATAFPSPSNSSAPKIAGKISTDGGSRTTAVHGGLVFVAASSNGLYIFGRQDDVQSANTPHARPMTPVQAYPNPFDREVVLEFPVLERTTVRASVYDLLGRVVAVLLDGQVSQGMNRITWDGDDSTGKQVPPGLYFIRIDSDTNRQVAPVVLVSP